MSKTHNILELMDKRLNIKLNKQKAHYEKLLSAQNKHQMANSKQINVNNASNAQIGPMTSLVSQLRMSNHQWPMNLQFYGFEQSDVIDFIDKVTREKDINGLSDADLLHKLRISAFPDRVLRKLQIYENIVVVNTWEEMKTFLIEEYRSPTALMRSYQDVFNYTGAGFRTAKQELEHIQLLNTKLQKQLKYETDLEATLQYQTLNEKTISHQLIQIIAKKKDEMSKAILNKILKKTKVGKVEITLSQIKKCIEKVDTLHKTKAELAIQNRFRDKPKSNRIDQSSKSFTKKNRNRFQNRNQKPKQNVNSRWNKNKRWKY